MKYSEFKNNVKLIGFETKESNRDIYVERIHETVISVSKEFRFDVDTGWTGFSKEQENVLLALYAHACELAKTPLAEREEEKLYNVIFPTIQRDGNFIYMAKDNSNGDPLGIDWSDYIYMKRNPTNFAFTEQEIKDIDERYLAFKVEVKDE